MTEDTDRDWEIWGQKDPYFGVRSEPRFRSDQLSDEVLEEFFTSGADHIHYVFDVIRRQIAPDFTPKRALDFGCGTGRLVIPMRNHSEDVTGIDISDSMLAEARKNCQKRGCEDIRLVKSDDSLGALEGEYDFVHSFIVFQHINEKRGLALIQQLVANIASGGVGALHILYGKAYHPVDLGALPKKTWHHSLREDIHYAKAWIKERLPVRHRAKLDRPDPVMQMNIYNLNKVLFILQKAGVARLHIDMIDHGGELGAYVFFQKT